MKLVAGNSNRPLAEAISAYLDVPLAKCQVALRGGDFRRDPGERARRRRFVLQSTSFPTNDHLMELLIITDALRRSSARRITAVIPLFRICPAGPEAGPRTPISAKLVANIITNAGADRVLTVDLHAGQIQASSTSRPTTCSARRSWRATSGNGSTAASAWSSPGRRRRGPRPRWPSASTRRSRSSTSAASARASRK